MSGRTGTRSVVPPGGFGTLDDLVETLTWRSSGCTWTPCGLLLNVADYLGPVDRLARPRSNSSCIRPCFVFLLLAQPDATTLLERMHGDTPTIVETRVEFRLAVTRPSCRVGGGDRARHHRSSTSPSNCTRASGASAGRLALDRQIAVQVVVAEHREYDTQDSPRQLFAVAETDCMLVSEPGRWRVPGSTGSMRRDRIGPGPAR